MRLFALLSFVVVLAGCVYDRVGVHREVSVSFPGSTPDAQEVVQIVGGVVAPYELVREPTASSSTNNVVAYYRKQGTYCRVYLHETTVTAVVFEFTRGHGSTDFKEMTKSLKDQLSRRYGSRRVKVEH